MNVYCMTRLSISIKTSQLQAVLSICNDSVSVMGLSVISYFPLQHYHFGYIRLGHLAASFYVQMTRAIKVMVSLHQQVNGGHLRKRDKQQHR